MKEILEWKQELREAGVSVEDDDFIFPGRFGQPMDPSNFRKRVLHKIATDCGLPKLTFQVIRRTIATLGKSKGHVKDIQGMMRHSKASTTTDIYMQSLEPDVRVAVNSIHRELTGMKRKSRAKKLAKDLSQGQRKTAARKPPRGVVLGFATRMRQSRGREVLLNA